MIPKNSRDALLNAAWQNHRLGLFQKLQATGNRAILRTAVQWLQVDTSWLILTRYPTLDCS